MISTLYQSLNRVMDNTGYKAKELVRGKALQPAAQQCGHFRLVKSQDVGGLNLSEAACGDDFADTRGNLRLEKRPFRLGDGKVGKYVPT